MRTEKVFKIKISIFEYTVTVIVSENINKSRIKRIKILGKYEEGEDPFGMTEGDTTWDKCFVFLKFNSDINTIVHENVHAKQLMEKFLGTVFDIETEAYLLGYLTETIYNKIKKMNDVYNNKKHTTNNA